MIGAARTARKVRQAERELVRTKRELAERAARLRAAAPDWLEVWGPPVAAFMAGVTASSVDLGRRLRRATDGVKALDRLLMVLAAHPLTAELLRHAPAGSPARESAQSTE